MKTLQELFNQWLEPDVAEYYLACSMGLMKYEESFDEFRRVKGVFNTKNKYGDLFFEMLQQMSAAGILEKDSEDYQFRWNKSFDEYWFTPQESDRNRS